MYNIKLITAELCSMLPLTITDKHQVFSQMEQEHPLHCLKNMYAT